MKVAKQKVNPPCSVPMESLEQQVLRNINLLSRIGLDGAPCSALTKICTTVVKYQAVLKAERALYRHLENTSL